MITTSTLNDLLLYLYNELNEDKVQKLHDELNRNPLLLDVFHDWVNLMQELDQQEIPEMKEMEANLISYSLSTKTSTRI